MVFVYQGQSLCIANEFHELDFEGKEQKQQEEQEENEQEEEEEKSSGMHMETHNAKRMEEKGKEEMN